jgi:hypothetical protein
MTSTLPERFKLIVRVPNEGDSLQKVKDAIFAAGAGRYPGPGGYTECCWWNTGVGQFRPGAGANPALGKVGELELVGEIWLETLCVGRDVAKKAVEALKK